MLALGGIGILLFAVSGAATPTLSIGNITPTMNFAYVKIVGKVTRGPIYDAEQESLRFYVADDTGELQVGSFREVTQQLVSEGRVPTVGDAVEVEGTLRVRDDFTTLNLSSADKVDVIAPELTTRTWQEITRADELTLMELQGDVREIRQPYNGLTVVTVGNRGGEVDVAVYGDVEALYGPPVSLEPGDGVRLRAIVTFFRDAPQLVLRHPRDLTKLEPGAIAPFVSEIGNLTEARLDELVEVEGEVTRISAFSAGMRATVEDISGEITVVLWQDIADELREQPIERGARVRVRGKLTEYRGELEIIPVRVSDLTVLEAAPVARVDENGSQEATRTPFPTRAPTAIAVERSIGSIRPEEAGARVVVEGTILRASEFSQGMRYTLDDGTGRILLLIWSDVLETVAARGSLLEGARVRVLGEVEVFNGQLEVIPETGEAVELIAAAVVPTVAIRMSNSISTDDLDQRVIVRGTVFELADFSAGKKFTLQDDAGMITVTVFDNVLVTTNRDLAVGASVTVRGRVDVFQGELEVIADEVRVD